MFIELSRKEERVERQIRITKKDERSETERDNET